jgi:RimJ/RimL family protein N-acetyltransferase
LLVAQSKVVDLKGVVGTLVRLRPLQAEDLEMTLRWRNQDHIRCQFINTDLIEFEGHKRWFEGYLQKDYDYVFIFETTEEPSVPIGQIAVYDVDRQQGTCEIGRLMLGESEYAGRGLSTEAYGLLIKFIKEQLRMRTIKVVVKETNLASVAIQKHFGFSVDDLKDGYLIWRLDV